MTIVYNFYDYFNPQDKSELLSHEEKQVKEQSDIHSELTCPFCGWTIYDASLALAKALMRDHLCEEHDWQQ